ncbi:hypothetical protein EVAR_28156_1 [Eumeta japonica]|uniref:Uncharacterized protein n=1 Tax=Eumeta variegata TaxID=151549 RepID=A0A4C1VGH7_EUMVA|nr:hypothetical protein EVAR_28156_1 [Eumeta japonica]
MFASGTAWSRIRTPDGQCRLVTFKLIRSTRWNVSHNKNGCGIQPTTSHCPSDIRVIWVESQKRRETPPNVIINAASTAYVSRGSDKCERAAPPHMGPPYLRRGGDSAKRDLSAAAVRICFFNSPDVSSAEGNGDPDSNLKRDLTFDISFELIEYFAGKI